MSTDDTNATRRGSGSNDQLGRAPERTYTRPQLLAAIEAERYACSIAVWMTLQDALAEGADDKGLDGWMREAEQRVKNRLAPHGHSSEKRERQPLSQDAILDFAEGCTLQFHDLLEFARKVERAHGIEA